MSKSQDVKQRFDEEWYSTPCQDCTHWWDSSCDGALQAPTSDCKSFSPTRSVTIPLEIKRLKMLVYSLITVDIITVAIMVAMVVKCVG